MLVMVSCLSSWNVRVASTSFFVSFNDFFALLTVFARSFICLSSDALNVQ